MEQGNNGNFLEVRRTREELSKNEGDSGTKTFSGSRENNEIKILNLGKREQSPIFQWNKETDIPGNALHYAIIH